MCDVDSANGLRLRIIRERGVRDQAYQDPVTNIKNNNNDTLYEKPNGIRNGVFGSDGESSDSVTRRYTTAKASCSASCSNSTTTINSEGSKENASSSSSSSPASSTSSEVELGAHTTYIQSGKSAKPVPKKGWTFPFTQRERLIDEIINEKTASLILDPASVFAMGDKRSQDSRLFVRIWEHHLLPALEKMLEEQKVKEFTITVQRGKQEGHRVIELMTATDVSQEVVDLIKAAKDKHLEGDMRDRTTVRTRLGRVEYLADNPGPEPPSPLSTRSSDSWHPPVNVRRYTNPVMGDSVGPRCAQGGSATMGPLLQIAAKFYRVLNWHIFEDEDEGGENLRWNRANPPVVEACHPSLADCGDVGAQSVTIGRAAAYSGPMHDTSRTSGSIQRALDDGTGPTRETRTVTDWVLVETTTGPQVNRVRKVDMPTMRCDSFSESITQIADPVLGTQSMVYSTGRSSGYSFGQICEVLGTTRLRNNVRTRNWGIETPNHVPDDDWNRGGMGIPGDSGAPVIDQRTNNLLGQIWGRNRYKTKPNECPITWFTVMSDIYDDIQERMPGMGAPSLPSDSSLILGTARSTSPTPILPLPLPPASPIANPSDAGRRSTLASISENGDEASSPAPALTTPNQRRSVARTTAAARLSAYGSGIPGLEPIRRLTMIAHAATF